MNKQRFVLQLALILAMLAVISVASVALKVETDKYATELALEQMQIEGSRAYAMYHDVLMQWEALAHVATVFLVGFCAWMVIDIIVQKLKKQRRNTK